MDETIRDQTQEISDYTEQDTLRYDRGFSDGVY